jgi:hypothetical protein
MIPLKYQTSNQNSVIGQLISTDGDTVLSSATAIANTDIQLWKYNSTALVNKSTSGATYLSAGVWSITFSSDDTDTLGTLLVFTHKAGSLVGKSEFIVQSANVYDSLVSTSDYLQVDAVQIAGVASTDQIATSTEMADSIWVTSTVRTLTTGAISSLTFSSGAISTLTISTAAWDQSANAVWSALRSAYVSTLTMGYTQSTIYTMSSLSYSSGWLSSLAFGLAAISSVALSSGAISTLTISTAAWDQGSYAVWANSTKALTDRSSFALSTISIDAVVDVVWDELRSGHVSTLSMGYTQSTLYTISASAISTTDYDNISNNVWANSTRTLTAGAGISTADYDRISSAVWTRATRELTAISSTIPSSGFMDYISTVVWGYATRALTAISSYNLSTTERDAITAVVWAATVRSITDRSSFSLSTIAIDNIFSAYVESTETIKDTMKLIRAASLGVSTGGGSTQVKFYDPSTTKARITADVSTDGNRPTIVTDLT